MGAVHTQPACSEVPLSALGPQKRHALCIRREDTENALAWWRERPSIRCPQNLFAKLQDVDEITVEVLHGRDLTYGDLFHGADPLKVQLVEVRHQLGQTVNLDVDDDPTRLAGLVSDVIALFEDE